MHYEEEKHLLLVALVLTLASSYIWQFMKLLVHFYSKLTLNPDRVFIITSFSDQGWNLVVYCCKNMLFVAFFIAAQVSISDVHFRFFFIKTPQISRNSHTKLYYRNRGFIIRIFCVYRGVSVLFWPDNYQEVCRKHVTRWGGVQIWNSKIDVWKTQSESESHTARAVTTARTHRSLGEAVYHLIA